MRRRTRRKLDLRIPREAVAGFALLLTLLALGSAAAPPSVPQTAATIRPAASAKAAVTGTPEPLSRGEVRRDLPQAVSIPIKVYNNDTGKVMEMDLEQYILCVTAAEVPASYEMEAIKAQAVAARTYAVDSMRAFGGSGYSKGNADASTSSAEFQAYADEAELKKRWGADYEYYMQRIRQAVEATSGQILTYNGKPIHALFHAVSGGRTEDVQAVFNMNLPYLKSVVSSGEENAPRFKQNFTFTRKKLADLLNRAYPKAQVSAGRLQGQLEIKSRLPSGQVDEIRIGQLTITGREFRKATGIGSANFTIGYTDSQAVIYTKGFGHGVGMSQAGANAMAKGGSDYKSILLHYYTDVKLTNVSSLLKQ